MRAASHNCDAIVVGAGTQRDPSCILSLALWGFRVLLIETGGRRPDGPPARQAWLRKIGHRLVGAGAHPDPDRWNAPILHYSHRNSRTPRETEAILGRGVGGSSTLYAAALGRMRRKDFEVSRRGAPTDLEQPLPNAWPISFNEFRIYYRRAEALLRIAGERDPLDADDNSDPVAPPDLSPRDAVICERLVRNGLHPYRLRVGFDYKPGCAECQGRRCPIGCKADGESRALAAALATGRVTLETDATVKSIAQGPEGVSVRIRSASDEIETRAAATLVLAAGALNTPLILARSPGLWPDAPPPAMLGRGLMFHISEIFAVRVPRRLGRSNVRKTLALRDFYDAGAESLGEIQSMGLDLSTGQAMHYLREIGSARLLRGVKGLAEFFPPLRLGRREDRRAGAGLRHHHRRSALCPQSGLRGAGHGIAARRTAHRHLLRTPPVVSRREHAHAGADPPDLRTLPHPLLRPLRGAEHGPSHGHVPHGNRSDDLGDRSVRTALGLPEHLRRRHLGLPLLERRRAEPDRRRARPPGGGSDRPGRGGLRPSRRRRGRCPPERSAAHALRQRRHDRDLRSRRRKWFCPRRRRGGRVVEGARLESV